MVDKLHQLNTHAIISVWPSIGIESPMYKDKMNQGLLYAPLGSGNFRYVDAYNPMAMDVYCKYLYDNIYSLGFDGWWHDSTEPDVMNALKKESHLYEMKRMQPNYLGSFTRYLNPYVLAMLDKSYQKWREQGNQKRACILTRSAFAGLQRDACITWTGDIGASWEIYQAQIKAGINYCYSGLPWWTFDVGGFVIGSYLGVFTWGIPQYKNVLVKFDNFRYRLMPYIYSIGLKLLLITQQ